MFDGDQSLWNWVKNLGTCPPPQKKKLWRPKTSQFRRDFRQLRNLITNVSETKQDTVKWTTALQTTTTHSYIPNLANFGRQTAKNSTWVYTPLPTGRPYTGFYHAFEFAMHSTKLRRPGSVCERPTSLISGTETCPCSDTCRISWSKRELCRRTNWLVQFIGHVNKINNLSRSMSIFGRLFLADVQALVGHLRLLNIKTQIITQTFFLQLCFFHTQKIERFFTCIVWRESNVRYRIS